MILYVQCILLKVKNNKQAEGSMSYQERRAFASLISTILFSAFYIAYLIQHYPAGSAYSSDVFHFWGSTIFILTPVSIVINIVTHILFDIIITMATNERERPFSD